LVRGEEQPASQPASHPGDGEQRADGEDRGPLENVRGEEAAL